MVDFLNDEYLHKLNHSCAHLMAQAVKHLYPDAKFWVGPVIESGFYYDMDLGDKVINDDDIVKIEKEMKKLAKDGKKIIRHEVSKEEALKEFKDDPYKLDLINRMEDGTITTYSQGDYTDLCRGPHVDSVKECKNFKLIKFSGAYWKGDSNNKMLQRIYGVCFPSKEELDDYLKSLEEAKLRDHRKIGKDLEIFMTSDLVGKGLPMYLPNGYTLWRVLQNYITDMEVRHGYLHVHTPDIGSKELYVTSGHWDHYKDSMFPAMELDNETYVMRPMNCPHHMVMFANKLHSYRDMPVRIAEIANDFRYEAAGACKGIERARSFTQNDSHIFCRPDQVESEFKGVVNLILEVYKDMHIDAKKCEFRLSLRDKNSKTNKYFDDDQMWDNAEDSLRKVLNDIGIDYFEAKDEAAFYGPKLDILIHPAVGNPVALSTIQLDFLLPKRFDLSYIDQNGEKKCPVVIHRAILGSLDRFIAFYLEETMGHLPLWLAPVEVAILPVKNEYHLDYAKELTDKLRLAGLRVELNDADEKLSYRMREEQVKKIPITLVVGDKERDESSVTVRAYGVDEQRVMSIDEFISYANKKISSKDNKLDYED